MALPFSVKILCSDLKGLRLCLLLKNQLSQAPVLFRYSIRIFKISNPSKPVISPMRSFQMRVMNAL